MTGIALTWASAWRWRVAWHDRDAKNGAEVSILKETTDLMSKKLLKNLFGGILWSHRKEMLQSV